MNSRAVGIVILNMVFSLVEDDDVAAEADRAVLGLRSHARGMARVGSRGNEPLIRYLGPIRPLKGFRGLEERRFERGPNARPNVQDVHGPVVRASGMFAPEAASFIGIIIVHVLVLRTDDEDAMALKHDVSLSKRLNDLSPHPPTRPQMDLSPRGLQGLREHSKGGPRVVLTLARLVDQHLGSLGLIGPVAVRSPLAAQHN